MHATRTLDINCRGSGKCFEFLRHTSNDLAAMIVSIGDDDWYTQMDMISVRLLQRAIGGYNPLILISVKECMVDGICALLTEAMVLN